jgi:hypothetical protein
MDDDGSSVHDALTDLLSDEPLFLYTGGFVDPDLWEKISPDKEED